MDMINRNILDFALLQSGAECYLDQVDDFNNGPRIRQILRAGNNHPEQTDQSDIDPLLSGATRFTPVQAQWFTDNYRVVSHYPSDASGFSCTLFQNNSTYEYTLSFRSTEYQLKSSGGDWERDGIDGADGDISGYGFALGQLSSMETFYHYLKQGKTWNGVTRQWEANPGVADFASGTPVLNLTGYSLGAHLSTAFTLMHWYDVANTYNFNAAGVGGLGADNGVPTGNGISALVEIYDTLMSYRLGEPVPTDSWWNDLVVSSPYLDTLQSIQGKTYTNVYKNPLHGVVMDLLAPLMYPAGITGLGGLRFSDSGWNWLTSHGYGPLNRDPDQFTSDLFQVDGWATKIHQVYGHGAFFDPELVANGGYHATPEGVWIEDLPTSRGLGVLELAGTSIRDLVGDYGETHSITPLIDSLTVFDLLQTIQPDLDQHSYADIMAAMANSRHALPPNPMETAIAEGLAQFGGKFPGLGKLFTVDTIYDADALENLVNALTQLFAGSNPRLTPDYSATGYANLEKREQLHVAIADLKTTIGNLPPIGLISLIGMSPSDMADKATQQDAEGMAYRYALTKLNPFVVVGLNYGAHNADGQLEVYDPKTGEGVLSEQYLADRAALLSWKLLYDTGKRDSNDVALNVGDKSYDESWDSNASGNWDYVDRSHPGEQPLTLEIDGAGLSRYDHQIVFGNLVSETLSGSGDDDHLYGMAGNDELTGDAGNDFLEGGADDDTLAGDEGADTLDGGSGDDRLEGGKDNDLLRGGLGTDTYVYASGDGLDIVDDCDGSGMLMVAGAALTLDGAEKFGPDCWRSADKNYEFILNAADANGNRDLFICAGSANSNAVSLVVDHFHSGDLGLSLPDGDLPVTPPAPSTDLIGDRTPIDSDKSRPGIQERKDSAGNVVTDPEQPEPGRKDSLYGANDKDDRLAGLGGSDRLEGKGGNDLLEGGTERDNLLAGDGNDVLYGGERVDFGSAAEFRLFGGETGDGSYGDFLSAAAGDDTLVGSAQSDALMGGEGDDVLLGGAGHDVLFGDATYEVADPEFEWTLRGLPEAYPAADEDTPGWGNGVGLGTVKGDLDSGSGGRDQIFGGSGGDWIIAGRGNDIVYGESGMDAIDGGPGSDVLYGGEDDDSILGDLSAGGLTDYGSDYIDLGGGTANQSAKGDGGNDVIIGGETADLLEGDDVRAGAADYHGADFVDGKGGNDTIYGEGESDQLFGGDGDDIIRGDSSTGQIAAEYQGDDYIEGGSGDDKVAGDGGADTIYGGSGADFLFGDAPDVAAEAQGDDVLYGEAGADQLYGGGGSDLLDGGDDADLLVGGDGGDSLVGGLGDDELQGNDGNDRLDGGSGDDRLFGQGGDDTLLGGLGSDVLVGDAGNDRLSGGVGSDSLFGGEGNDTLSGGAGRDLYIYNLGDGEDVIEDFVGSGSGGLPGNPDNGIGNILQLGSGILRKDISLGVGSLLVKLSGGGAIHIAGFDVDQPLANPVIDTFGFADGSSIGLKELVAQGFDIVGSANSDQLRGTAFGDRIQGLGGADYLFAGAGDDRLDGAGGNDSLDGGEGNDTLIGGQGDDQYWVDSLADEVVESEESGHDTVKTALDGYVLGSNLENLWLDFGAVTGTGNAAANELKGNGAANRLFGLAGNDSLDGAGGNDVLAGGDGDDAYRFGHGYGEDSVMDSGGADDRVQLGGGATVAEVVLSRAGNDVVVALAGGKDRLIMKDWYLDGSRIEHVDFADGSSLDGAAIERLLAPPLTVQDDAVALDEDAVTAAEGNVLANDGVADGLVLSVGNPGQYPGGFGTLDLATDGRFSYGLKVDSATVQGLREGQQVEDRFAYSAIEQVPGNPRQAEAELVVTVTGRNDAPVALADAVEISEDAAEAVSGNLLVNDSDPDLGSVLKIVNPGSMAGRYGSLIVTGNGDYSYRLDPVKVQGLAAGETVAESFSYRVADDETVPLIASSNLMVTIVGANDAPLVAHELLDQVGQTGRPLSFAVPADAFADPDGTDTLTLSASLAGGGALPAWLAFDPATATFHGTPPGTAAGAIELAVTATDSQGLAVSDSFSLTISVGSETGIERIGTRRADLLWGSEGDDSLWGLGGPDALIGGEGNDFLDGGSGNAWLMGQGGADVLDGGSGRDWLMGGDGGDVLRGGAGGDQLVGGMGADVFDCRDFAGTKDRVLDFGEGGGNTVSFDNSPDLSGIDGDVLVLGYGDLETLAGGTWVGGTPPSGGRYSTLADADLAVNAGGRSEAPRAQLVYDTRSGLLSFDPDGTGSQPAVPVALLGTWEHPALAAQEIVIAA
ncbi:MAG: hypothetical protein FIA97_13745 [Methylococcaceae bacterium]|nr:hypothetical protein [Methylococcaceae bacterium]